MKKLFLIVAIILTPIFASCTDTSYVTVSFESNGGTTVETVLVPTGRTISIPGIERSGYILDGWYSSLDGGTTFDEKWSFTQNTVSSDITLYAKWIFNPFVITFNSNGGSNVNPITISSIEHLAKPVDPTKSAFTFAGWFTDTELNNPYDFQNLPNQSVALYAKWVQDENTVLITIIVKNIDGAMIGETDVFGYESESFIELLNRSNLSFIYSVPGTYGVSILGISGISVGATEYWSHTINGNYSTSGVSTQGFSDGDIFIFQLVDWSK